MFLLQFVGGHSTRCQGRPWVQALPSFWSTKTVNGPSTSQRDTSSTWPSSLWILPHLTVAPKTSSKWSMATSATTDDSAATTTTYLTSSKAIMSLPRRSDCDPGPPGWECPAAVWRSSSTRYRERMWQTRSWTKYKLGTSISLIRADLG